MVSGKTILVVDKEDEDEFLSLTVFKSWKTIHKYLFYNLGYYDPAIDEFLYALGLKVIIILLAFIYLKLRKFIVLFKKDSVCYLSLPLYLSYLMFKYCANKWTSARKAKKETVEMKALFKQFTAQMKKEAQQEKNEQNNDDEADDNEENEDEEKKKVTKRAYKKKK
jgi:hypothetical protein